MTNQEMLEEIYELTKENNEILHNLRNRARLGTALKTLYFLIVIGVVGGAFYYARPYVEKISGGALKVQQMINNLEAIRATLPEANTLNNLMQNLKQ